MGEHGRDHGVVVAVGAEPGVLPRRLAAAGEFGDGFFTVVTPQSPVGKATMGLQVGDTFDITVDGETRSWEITWIG